MTAPRFQGRRHQARSLALAVLLECDQRERFIQEALDLHLNREESQNLSALDRQLATHLAYGAIRRRGSLFALLQPLVSRPVERVEPWLWHTLTLGAYQLAYTSRIPVHAALHETVELASAYGRPEAKGFLNGVLRAFGRLMTPEIVETPGPDALPLEGGSYRRLARPVLPDPRDAPVEYLAKAFGFPMWLIERWRQRLPDEELRRLGFWFAGPAALTLRVNPLRTTRERLLEALTQQRWHAEPGDHPQAVRLRDHATIRELPGYAEGWFCVQDESAMHVGSALAVQPGATVLDLCAAPGGKSTHLAECLGNQGRVVACDIDATRLGTVRELATRLGVSCLETVRVDPQREESVPAGPFDFVLADVPCSNTGVLGRRPEARWRLRPHDIAELSQVQERLLRLAIGRARPGGVVVYSTCSVEPEENRLLVQRVVALGIATLETEVDSVPGRPADGGYWARLRK